MKKLMILSLIVTIFGSSQIMANTNSDNITPAAEEESNFIILKNLLIFKKEAPNLIITENEAPMCPMIPTEIPTKVISEYPGLHELAAQSNQQFSDSDLTYMCQYIYIRELNPDAQDENGNTALHIAAAHINHKAMKVLLEAGANPTLTNNEGLTPLDIAEAIVNERYDNINHLFRGVVEIGEAIVNILREIINE